MSVFTVISLSKEENNRKILKKGFGKGYKKRMLKSLPVDIKTTAYLSNEGERIVLPFTKSEADILGDDFVKEFIEKLIKKYDIAVPIFEEDLKRYESNLSEDNSKVIKYLMIKEILEAVCELEGIEKRKLKFIIIDSGDRKTEYMLEILLEEFNYLTIVTKREEYFSEFKDIIYMYNGLAVETVAAPLNGSIEGNIIINMDDRTLKDFIFFEKNSIVLDMESTAERRQYLYQRRKDIKYIYDIPLLYEGRKVDNRILGNIICNRSWLVDGLIRYGKKFASADEIREIMLEYSLKIECLKCSNY